MSEMLNHAFGDRPDRERRAGRKFREVLRPGPKCEVKAVITSNRLLIVWTHYVDRVSYPCVGAEHDCYFCPPEMKNTARMRGFVSVLDWQNGRHILAELTGESIRGNAALSSGETDLRGAVLFMRRNGDAPNARVSASISRSQHVPSYLKNLPEPFDIHDAVKALLGPVKLLKDADKTMSDEESLELFKSQTFYGFNSEAS